MAAFNLGNAGDISSLNDFPKIQSYLYKLNEQLRYMFDNLSPEDNYNDQALLKYVSDGEKQSAIEVSLEQISLSMVDKDNVVAAINMSKEGIQIQADKIKMEGLVTVNSYFKIGLDGSIEAKNGKFSGHISASSMESSTIDSSEIRLGGDGKDGKIIVYNSSGTEIGRWSQYGIDVKQGSITGTGITVGGYGNTGYVRVLNSQGTTEIGRWDNNGINVYQGSITGTAVTLGGSGTSGLLTVKNSSNRVVGTWGVGGLSIARGSEVGFFADGDEVYIGEFMVADLYGRQILESLDETTGMSGEPNHSGGYYLWAGWYGNNNFVFAVDNNQNVSIHGGLYLNNVELGNYLNGLENRIEALERSSGGEPE